MASVDDWRIFVQERLRAYDSEMNLDQGSSATVQIVDPIVARLEPDPLETNLQLFLLTRLQQEYPELYAREGAAITDLLIKPMRVFLEPFRREIRSVKNQLSLANPERLMADEADALLGNLFVRRNEGEYARVKVRIYFQNPVSVTIGSQNVAYTGTGLRFLPVNSQSLTSEAMLFNTDGSLYYFDVNFISERPGTRYNIGASEIINVSGVTAATRATNLAKAAYGLTEETTIQFIDRGERSTSEQSLNTVPGIVRSLFDEFDELRILQVIGFNDEDMGRDILKGGNLGSPLYSGTDGNTSDDGDVDGYTDLFDVVSSVDFTTALGPVGTDISDYSLTVWWDPGTAVEEPFDLQLGEVMGATQVSLHSSVTGTSRLPDNLSGAYWCIRTRASLTLSDIPGGIIFPDVVDGTTLTVPNDTVHIGGCTDFYVRGGTLEDKTLSVQVLADQNVIYRGESATTQASAQVDLTDLPSTEFGEIVEGRTVLYMEEGPNAGPHLIVKKSGTYTVWVATTGMVGPLTTDVGYTLVDDIDIDLLEPKEIKYEGTDLRTVAGSDLVDTVGGTPDFGTVGVVDTDALEVESGPDEGVYEIDTGGVSGNQITLESNMTTTRSPLPYRIFRRQTGIELPLVRVTAVERLDSGLEPTGEYVPYRHPVDAQSRSFQNPGRGAKAGTGITDDTEALTRQASPNEDVVQSNTITNFWDEGVRVGDLVNINTSDNQGYYTVVLVGGSIDAQGTLSDNQLQLDQSLQWPASGMEYELGSPSYGSFRVYFKDPCTFEALYSDTIFSVTSSGVTRRFRPDPDIWDQFLPSETTVPTGAFAASSTVTPRETDGDALDLVIHDLQVGDRVEVTYAPLVGTLELSAGGIDLDGKTMVFDVGYGEETVTYSGTSLSIDEIISQTNAQLSQSVAAKYEDPSNPGDYYFMLRADRAITLKANGGGASDATVDVFGTDRSVWQYWLAGTFVNVDTSNKSPEKDAGPYLVATLATYPATTFTLTLDDGSSWTATGTTIENDLGHYLHISRGGRQRISSTEMDEQQDELGLYYFDVECISEGYGDTWNIDADLQAVPTGYYSEGWSISTTDSDLSFSMAEEPWLDISPRILVVGNDDDATQYTHLMGSNIQISYERDDLVEQVDTYVRDTQTRIVCESPLARSLFPIFVRVAFVYLGGGTETSVREDLVELIDAVLPEDELEVADMLNIIRKTGSTSETLPVTLVGIAHRSDRTIWIERSEDAISTGRLSALLEDEDSDGNSYILLTRNV